MRNAVPIVVSAILFAILGLFAAWAAIEYYTAGGVTLRLQSIVLLILALGIFFAVFGPAERSEQWQFRLRSLLVAVTGVCVVFALIGNLGFHDFAAHAFALALLLALIAFGVDIYRHLSNS